MIFKPMKSEDVRKALEGHEDILSKAAKEVETYFKRLPCPACKGEVMAVVDSRMPFREGSILPNFLGRCKVCGIDFEPYTGIQLTMPR